MLSEVVEDGFGGFAGVDDEGLETGRGGGRDGDVVGIVDAAEVAETSLQCDERGRISLKKGRSTREESGRRTNVEAGKTTLILELLHRGENLSLTLTSALTRLSLDRLLPRRPRRLLRLGLTPLLLRKALPNLLQHRLDLLLPLPQLPHLANLALLQLAELFHLLLDAGDLVLSVSGTTTDVGELLSGDLGFVRLGFDLLLPRSEETLVFLDLSVEGSDLVCER